MREWAKANGGPVGLVALGILAVFPSKILGGALIAVGLCWYVYTHDRLHRWVPIVWKGFGAHSSHALNRSYIADQEVRVVDLVAPGETNVTGKTLERCKVVGPAILALLDGTVADSCSFDIHGLTPDALFWEIESDRWVLGAIGLKRCTFRNCSFERCGIVGTKSDREYIQGELSKGRPPQE